ncbi:hypothetical protein [Terasakiella sp.]|uniref:hypothetical protein n=1 Tax=Terasakiella sp. TaxID=2034861 RepID=UPI003AA81DE3
MTKTTDQQLKRWLDAFKVDTSAPRLSRLEDRILLSIPCKASPIFRALSFKDGLFVGLGVLGLATCVLWAGHLLQNTETASYVLAGSYLYGGF